MLKANHLEPVMCGVIGFYHPSPGPEHYDRIKALFHESRVRGEHAFGFSYFSPRCKAGLNTFRALELGGLNGIIHDLDQTARFNRDSPLLLIGHTRYSTGGDWKTLSNNQPLTLTAPPAALAFNGTLDMRPPEAWPTAYGFKFSTTNDGEIYLRQLEAKEEPVPALRRHKGTFAGTILRQTPGGGYEALGLRNKMRPLWWAEDDNGGRYVASTQDIFRRAAPTLKAAEVKPFTLLTIGSIQPT
jgi:glutamine phosphoribosylpyrophosphate amidotransferase